MMFELIIIDERIYLVNQNNKLKKTKFGNMSNYFKNQLLDINYSRGGFASSNNYSKKVYSEH